MSTICIQRSHNLSSIEVKNKIDQIILEIEKKLEFSSYWESETYLSFKRKGAKGFIEIGEDEFELNLKLGMMFKMLKNTIRKEIIAVIDSHL